MRTILSLFWKFVASAAAALGLAVVARIFSKEPRAGTLPPETSAAPSGPALGPGLGQGAGGMAARPAQAGALRPGWSRPAPDKIPRPTYWPAVFALGIMFLFWGLISNVFILGLGAILFVIATAGWIGDLLNE